MLGDDAVAADAQPRFVPVRLPAPGIAKRRAAATDASGADAVPRLCAVMRISISSMPACAYSTNTSKYRFSSNTPVSSSSNSGAPIPRR